VSSLVLSPVRETSDLGATSYDYDAASRLLQAGGASFAYDDAGRLVEKQAAGDVTTYEYDAAGRLRKVLSDDGSGLTYGYDAFGRKVAREATFWALPGGRNDGPPGNGGSNGNGADQGNHYGWERGNHYGWDKAGGKPSLETETTTYLWDGLSVLAEYTENGAPLAEYYSTGERMLARKMFGLHDRKEPGAPDLQTHGGLLKGTDLAIGTLTDPSRVTVTSAGPLGSNPGGLVELVVPNPSKQITGGRSLKLGQ